MYSSEDGQNSAMPGFDRRMTKEEINNFPIRKWDGPVHVIHSSEEMTGAVEKLSREPVLGFDTETRPAFKKGQKYMPSLLQLAGENSVYLFQLKHLGLREPLRQGLSAWERCPKKREFKITDYAGLQRLSWGCVSQNPPRQPTGQEMN